MDYVASNEQIEFLEAATGEAFQLPLLTEGSETFEIVCPTCHHSFKASWMAASSDGLGSNLLTGCMRCSILITDDAIGMAQVLSDIDRATCGDGIGLA
jgi:hypothetical protein